MDFQGTKNNEKKKLPVVSNGDEGKIVVWGWGKGKRKKEKNLSRFGKSKVLQLNYFISFSNV